MTYSYDDGLRKEVAGAGQTGSVVRTRRAALETLILDISKYTYMINEGSERRLSWVERVRKCNCRRSRPPGHALLARLDLAIDAGVEAAHMPLEIQHGRGVEPAFRVDARGLRVEGSAFVELIIVDQFLHHLDHTTPEDDRPGGAPEDLHRDDPADVAPDRGVVEHVGEHIRGDPLVLAREPLARR